MATFISLARGDASSGYTATVPDFTGFAVQAMTLDDILSKVREGLATHIERLLGNNEIIPIPTSVDAIKCDGAFLLFAVEMPDDIGEVQIDLAVPALALARMDSFAGRNGLTRASLFVLAVDRWIVQESLPRSGMRQRSADPTLFDFITPPELKMETEATGVDRAGEAAVDPARDGDIERSVDNITQELERLLEESSHPQPASGGKKES